jgi:uncharacterized membrane protein
MIDTLRFINVFAQGFFVGSMNWALMDTVPAMRRMTERESVRTHQTQFDDLPDRFLPAFAFAAVIADVLLLIVADLTTTAFTLYAVGFAAMFGVGLLTIMFNIPVNRTIRHWSPDAIPPEYPAMRRRWNRVHACRVLLGSIAFACFIVATINP